MNSGAATNSFAITPTTPTPAAKATRSCNSRKTTNGARKYISGSDVNGSCSVYNDPKPKADITAAITAARDDSPHARLRTSTAAAAAVFASTA